MKKIDQELGIDDDFGISDNDQPESLPQEDLETLLNPQPAQDSQEEELPIQAELARINQREKVEMGRQIEELRRRVDERDLKVGQ